MTDPVERERLSTFQLYWRLYGGWPAIVYSRYLWAGFAFSALCFPVWLENENGERIWTEFAIGIIPSLMAFSLGSMAILLAFSNEKFLVRIQKKGEPDSLFMKASATFFHFILIQTFSLAVAFLSKSFDINIISFVGFWLLCYGMGVAVAAAGILLKMAEIFNAGSS